MDLKKRIKSWLYGYCPGFSGSFPYYGAKVFFPKNSHIFKLACKQGIYERSNVGLISNLLKSNSVYLDIGANIGLMSIPILHSHPDCKVISVEPSPNSLPFLTQTHKKSEYKDRWFIIGKATSSDIGNLRFSIASSTLGAFDGLKDTGRAGNTTAVTVPVTTVDTEWELMGQPNISVIKIDVEGAELQVLEGAVRCITSCNPCILVEWNLANLKAYNCDLNSLLIFSQTVDYRLFSVVDHQSLRNNHFLDVALLPVSSPSELRLQMLTTENFLLVPKLLEVY